MNKTPYQHPKFPNVAFWDLPGTSAPISFHIHILKWMGFANYDFFIIVASSWCNFNNILLDQNIWELGKKFDFVGTKVDNDSYNEVEKQGQVLQKGERVLQQIKDNCLSSLSSIRVHEPDNFLAILI